MERHIIVSMPSKAIRTIARDALKGEWKAAIITAIIYYLIVAAPISIISILFGKQGLAAAVTSIYVIIVSGPLTYGFTLYVLSLFRKRDHSAGQLFAGFEIFGKTLGLMLLVFLKTLLWTLLFVIPGIVAAFRYSMCFYIMVDHPEYSIGQCIDESKKMMNGNKSKLFCLSLSFIGWAILAELPAAIVNFYQPAENSAFGLLFIYALLLTIAELPICVVSIYIEVAEAGFYEILAGNLMEVEENAEGILAAIPEPVEPAEEVAVPELSPETPEEAKENEDLQVIETVQVTTEEEDK